MTNPCTMYIRMNHLGIALLPGTFSRVVKIVTPLGMMICHVIGSSCSGKRSEEWFTSLNLNSNIKWFATLMTFSTTAQEHIPCQDNHCYISQSSQLDEEYVYLK